MFSNRLNVEHLSENECETLLDVLERDRELRTKERIRLRPEESNRVLGKPPIDHRARSVVDSLESLSHLSYTLQQSLDHYVTPSTSTNSLSPDDRQLGLRGSYSRRDYLEDESRFSYDSVSRQFVRSVHKEISAVLKEKLSACDTREQIPPLSLDDFRRSMKSFLNVTSEPKPETPTQNSKDQLVQLAPSQTPSAKLDASDFFNSKTRPGENILQKEEMVSFSYNAQTPSSSTDAVNKQAELTFDDLKEEEVKRFLVELSMLTDQIKEGLVGDVTDSQTEEMLTTQKAAVAAMIVSLQQSLYLAVDNQSSISKDKLVKHSQVPSIVCSIVKESIGHPLPPEVIADDGEVDCNAVAECILAEVLDEGISHADPVDTPDSVYSSGYDISYKLPSFDVNRNDLDPDLLSLDGITRATSQEDDAMSELSGPWDSDSVAR
ncbi:hypothetical protein EB796_019260 [Bugula neritina]|uniref:Uncharacterized protein n=1 Tax=Bugula neritina TaxID=10212 RepID=A0A7J7J9L0_BUGNE|nr:hypothetical protein EB796_019260 [Bugula neritina]